MKKFVNGVSSFQVFESHERGNVEGKEREVCIQTTKQV
jgi:hypothetical protein